MWRNGAGTLEKKQYFTICKRNIWCFLTTDRATQKTQDESVEPLTFAQDWTSLRKSNHVFQRFGGFEDRRCLSALFLFLEKPWSHSVSYSTNEAAEPHTVLFLPFMRLNEKQHQSSALLQSRPEESKSKRNVMKPWWKQHTCVYPDINASQEAFLVRHAHSFICNKLIKYAAPAAAWASAPPGSGSFIWEWLQQDWQQHCSAHDASACAANTRFMCNYEESRHRLMEFDATSLEAEEAAFSNWITKSYRGGNRPVREVNYVPS